MIVSANGVEKSKSDRQFVKIFCGACSNDACKVRDTGTDFFFFFFNKSIIEEIESSLQRAPTPNNFSFSKRTS